jgi:hypothetical protein
LDFMCVSLPCCLCLLRPALLIHTKHQEAFQQLWDYTSPAWSGKFLDEWCRQTMRSRIEPTARSQATHSKASSRDAHLGPIEFCGILGAQGRHRIDSRGTACWNVAGRKRNE